MNLESRKYNLIEQVMQFDEPELIKLETFLEEESKLSASLDLALTQVEEGKVTPHLEVRKKYEKWLSK